MRDMIVSILVVVEPRFRNLVTLMRINYLIFPQGESEVIAMDVLYYGAAHAMVRLCIFRYFAAAPYGHSSLSCPRSHGLLRQASPLDASWHWGSTGHAQVTPLPVHK